jgi:hypothetical protein
MTSLSTTLQRFDSPLWGYHFPIASSIANKFIEGKDRRIICDINGMHKMQCALMPWKEGYFILINKDLVTKLKLAIDEKVQLTIEKDHSEFGHEVPFSFQALLEQDDEGKQYFYQLTKGKQRSLIYLVSKVKNIDSQINKGLAILDHLKMVKGALDFKKLNETIKEYNRKSRLL